MTSYKTFIFESYNFDIKTKTLELVYSFDSKLFFKEQITFISNKLLNIDEIGILYNVFKYIHIACGISYYKLFLTKNIEVKTFDLNIQQANFFNDFYREGLGEFCFKNNIENIDEIINFPFQKKAVNKSIKYQLPKKFCVPIGGGKDSIVSLEILKSFTDNIITGSVNTAHSIEEIIKISETENFLIKRTISPNLIELNNNLDKNGGYNGHVPITGILSFILCAGSIIYGYDTVIMSNERSSNVGNVKFGNKNINHQWSKSFDFEKKANKFFKLFIINSFNYVSLLRPLSEIHIVKLFAKLEKYHSIFKSCNKNFKIENRITNWCCDCDKCRFVFLILSIFLNKDKLTNIFGKNLLNEQDNLEAYMELVGLKNFKPFECVGEINESIYAILASHHSFNDSFIIKKLRHLFEKKDKEKLKAELFSLNPKHLLNQELLEHLTNYINQYK